jgi:hypothetical protein
VKDADQGPHQRELKARETDVLVVSASTSHEYPFCWRAANDPLIQYARPCVVREDERRSRTGCSRTTRRSTWRPAITSSEGRFGDFLRNNVDWARVARALSGARRCRCGSTIETGANWTCVGSDRPRSSKRNPDRRSTEVRRRTRQADPTLSPTTCACTGRGSIKVTWSEARASRASIGACSTSSTAGSTRGRCRSRSGTTRARTSRPLPEESFPADFICEGDRPDARVVLLAARASRRLLFDKAAVSSHVVRERAHQRQARQEDVEVARQHGRTRGR